LAAWGAEPFAGCQNEFFDRQPPVVAISARSYALCAKYFATLYSSGTKTPVYSAEHLTEIQIAAAIGLKRQSPFHEDMRLPSTDAVQLEDYRHSGWDRGHMAPSGDEPDAEAQFQSFTLSNMVPQNANDNRNLWAGIETAVRELVLAGGDDVYVVTGPIFRAVDPPTLSGGVAVPSFLFKAIYDPEARLAGVYIARNAPGKRYWTLSLDQFRSAFGIVPFPAVPGNLADLKPDLPQPIMLRDSGD
jgi:endonuclease G